VQEVDKDVYLHRISVGQMAHSVLWNSMIHPLLNLTIYGVIWYQG